MEDKRGVLNLTDTVVEKIMKSCGIENVTVIFKGGDYFVSILKMGRNNFEIEIVDIEKPVNNEDYFQLVITIDGQRYLLSLMVSSLRLEDKHLLISAKIVGKVCLELQSKLDEVFEALRFFSNRKEDRIICNDEVLKDFHIISKFRIVFPKREYTGFMRDISLNGINFFIIKEFDEENFEKYMLNIDFLNPSESISLAGEILRKKFMNISGNEFLNVTMKIEENLHLSKRILDYRRKMNIQESPLVIG